MCHNEKPFEVVTNPAGIAAALGYRGGNANRGTDRLLADIERAGEVRDTVEITDEAWARQQAREFMGQIGTLSKALDEQFLALLLQRAMLRGRMAGANRALDLMTKAAEEPERFDEACGPASCSCGRNHCGGCEEGGAA